MSQKHPDYISRELSRDLKIWRKTGLATRILGFIKKTFQPIIPSLALEIAR